MGGALALPESQWARALEGVARSWSRSHEAIYREGEEAWEFYKGDHWGYRNSVSGSWVAAPQAAPDVVRITVNKIAPYVEQGVSILRSGGTVFGAVASKGDRADASSAEAADAFSEYMWREHALSQMAEDTARHSYCAPPFVHVQWDGSRGRKVVTEETMVSPPELDDEGTILKDAEWDIREEPEGDHLFERLTTRQVVADPAAPGDQQGSGIFIRQEVPRSTIAAAYGLPDKKVPHTDLGSEDTAELRRMSEPPSRGGLYQSDATSRDSAVVWTFYCPSSAKYPLGKRIVFSEGRILDKGDNPIYPEDDEEDEMWPRCQWPIFQIGFTPRPHSYYMMAPVPQAVPPQKALNGVASKAVQHAAKIANCKVRVPKGATVDWSDEIGQVISVGRSQDASAYGYIAPPPMPPEYVGLWRQFDGEIQQILGINASTAGQSTSTEDSGRKIELLQKRDIGRLEPVKQRQDAVWGEVMLYALRLFRRYATTPRKIAIAGENNQLAIKSFDASQLATVVDILVFNDQSIPRDPSQRILWMTQFVQSGMLNLPPEQRQELITIMGLRDFKGFMAQEGHHRLKAKRAALLVLQGQLPDLWEEDDHLQHMNELSKLRCSEEFENKVRESGGGQSPVLAAFDRVYGWHKTQFEQAMAAQQGVGPQAPAGVPQDMGAAPATTPGSQPPPGNPTTEIGFAA